MLLRRGCQTLKVVAKLRWTSSRKSTCQCHRERWIAYIYFPLFGWRNMKLEGKRMEKNLSFFLFPNQKGQTFESKTLVTIRLAFLLLIVSLAFGTLNGKKTPSFWLIGKPSQQCGKLLPTSTRAGDKNEGTQILKKTKNLVWNCNPPMAGHSFTYTLPSPYPIIFPSDIIHRKATTSESSHIGRWGWVSVFARCLFFGGSII